MARKDVVVEFRIAENRQMEVYTQSTREYRRAGKIDPLG